MSSSEVSDGSLDHTAHHTPRVATLGWALRRAALGLLMLFVMVVIGAWLLYASIDPDEASAGGPASGQSDK